MRRGAMVAAGLLAVAASGSGAVAVAPTAAGGQTAAPTSPTAARPTPGGSVAWQPEGRVVVGRPTVYRGSWGGVELAWLDPTVLRPMFIPGTGDPGGPWPGGGQIPPEVRGRVAAAFNGGFKMGDISGGWYLDGRTVKSLVPGQASLVIYADGHATVGEWGRDVTLTPDVVAVRQNLTLLVDGGQPVPAASNPGAWGGSVAGVATARSGVGVDANGALVVAQARVSPAGLAAALQAAGAVRAMQMDINPDWVTFILYQPNSDGSIGGARVMGTGGPGSLYLSPYARDFFVMVIKPVVALGAIRSVGHPPFKVATSVG